MNKKKYLMIESNNILRCTYEIQREFIMNDFHNVYYQTGYENIADIFTQNGISQKYQRVIIEFNDNLKSYFPKTKEAKELLTKTKFMLSTITYSEKDGGIIYGITKSNLLEKAMSFNAKAEFLTYDEVLQFLTELNKLNLLDSYIRSLLIFFRMDNTLQSEDKVLKITY